MEGSRSIAVPLKPFGWLVTAFLPTAFEVRSPGAFELEEESSWISFFAGGMVNDSRRAKSVTKRLRVESTDVEEECSVQ